MKAKNGKVYETNYARAAAYFLGTCAQEPVGKERLAAYNLITGIYKTIATNPASLGFKPSPDVLFNPWEQQKGREKDVKLIRGPIAKIETLIESLYGIITNGTYHDQTITVPDDMKVPKALLAALLANGINCKKNVIEISEDCYKGLSELAQISGNNVIPITDGPQPNKEYLFFSRCVFDPKDNWTAKAFDEMLDAKGELIKLCDRLETLGYQRIDCYDGKNVSLDYVKQHGGKAEPLKWVWAERTHSGIALTFENIRTESTHFCIRMPMFKTVLSCGDQLPEQVRNFIADNTKVCDGCRYCVQTDKTGTRPLAGIMLNDKLRCPNFPGFTFNWRTLSPELAQNTYELLETLSSLKDIQ